MLHKYIERSNEDLKNGRYRQIDHLCFAEFLSLYYVLPETAQISKYYYQPMVLNDGESRFSDKIELTTHNIKTEMSKG